VRKNLVLLGMMGVGKTTLGKIVAKKQDLQFIDTDLCVEKKWSMEISEIFKMKKRSLILFNIFYFLTCFDYFNRSTILRRINS